VEESFLYIGGKFSIQASEAEVVGSGVESRGEGEPRREDGAGAAGLLRPSCFPERGLPPLPPPRRRESASGGSMAARSGAARVWLLDPWLLDLAPRGKKALKRGRSARGGMASSSLPLRTGLRMKQKSGSMAVSRSYRGLGNYAESFHHGETISLSFLPISCKNAFCADVSMY